MLSKELPKQVHGSASFILSTSWELLPKLQGLWDAFYLNGFIEFKKLFILLCDGRVA